MNHRLALKMLHCLIDGSIQRLQRRSIKVTASHTFHQCLLSANLLSLKATEGHARILHGDAAILTAASHQVFEEVHDVLIVSSNSNREPLILL
jgi:hypothetical protein